MTDVLLRMRNVSAEIGRFRVLNDVSLEVPRGGSVGIVGETGSGKSLSCRTMLGLLERIGGRVVGGTATFDGIDLLNLSARQWRGLRGHRIGFVPQASLGSLDPVMTIGHQLVETVRVLDPDSEPRGRALELLDAVQMARVDQVMSLYPHELSGGMRQRVMIALALAGRPELLVADEATTALDVTIQRAILDLLVRLRVEFEMALVMVTHDLAVVESICETVAVMYTGRVVEYGPVAQVHRDPQHPYTAALIGAQPSLTHSGSQLKAIPGGHPGLGDHHDGCSFAPRCQVADETCRVGRMELVMVGDDRGSACRKPDAV